MEQFIKDLQEGVYEIEFVKKDNSIRKMRCTLHPDIIPETGDSKRTLPENLITVYDIDNGWRSFYFNKLLSIRKVTAADILKDQVSIFKVVSYDS